MTKQIANSNILRRLWSSDELNNFRFIKLPRHSAGIDTGSDLQIPNSLTSRTRSNSTKKSTPPPHSGSVALSREPVREAIFPFRTKSTPTDLQVLRRKGRAKPCVRRGILNSFGLPASGHTRFYRQATCSSPVFGRICCNSALISSFRTDSSVCNIAATMAPSITR